MNVEAQTSRSPEETRNRILAATRQLFEKKGRRGTTTREIAELAAVNEATLFRHFGNKDALIEACAEHYCAAVPLQELLGSLDGDLQADLFRIGQALRERMEQIRDLIIMSLADEEADKAVGMAAWRAPTAIKQIVTDYMAKQVQAGQIAGDPALLARFFMGMIFAQVLGRNKFPELGYSVDHVLEFQISTFLNGVRKK